MKYSFQTPGYEHLELSTQIMIAEALKRRVKVEILDPQDQLIRLTQGKHLEYVESASKTSKDSYITSLILGNKIVSKHILKEKGLNVPQGSHFFNYNEALKAYQKLKNKKIVVKPKTTNYGIGITMLNKEHSQTRFKTALKTAFSYDRAILIEEFIEGIEYRFLVIDGTCVAVLQRVPANVVGDGRHSIKELIEVKNSHPYRGKGHKTPLEYIELGQVEVRVLEEQNLTPASVPKNDHQIFLRHNSNISTGGDSIDRTDRVHEGYKRIAEKATKAVFAAICGVDIILKNPTGRPTTTNYAIIEVNYNPVLYFHNFPLIGKNRHTGKYILDLLGFNQ